MYLYIFPTHNLSKYIKKDKIELCSYNFYEFKKNFYIIES